MRKPQGIRAVVRVWERGKDNDKAPKKQGKTRKARTCGGLIVKATLVGAFVSCFGNRDPNLGALIVKATHMCGHMCGYMCGGASIIKATLVHIFVR